MLRRIASSLGSSASRVCVSAVSCSGRVSSSLSRIAVDTSGIPSVSSRSYSHANASRSQTNGSATPTYVSFAGNPFARLQRSIRSRSTTTTTSTTSAEFHSSKGAVVGGVANAAKSSKCDPPTPKQLRTLFVASAVPFVAFGFVDNTVLIQAGDLIDNTFGVYFALPTLAAAAMGQVFSDTSGVLFGSYIEMIAVKLGLPMPKISPEQYMMRVSRLVKTAGAVIGVVTGCCLGMVNLLLIDLGASERQKREAELKTIFESLVFKGHEVAECERVSLFVVDSATQEMWTLATSNKAALRMPITKGFAGYTARTGDVVRTDCACDDARFFSDIDRQQCFVTRNLLCAPVLDSNGKVVAVVQFVNKKVGPFTMTDEKLIQMLCHHVAIFMQNSKSGSFSS
mmetsp:Transcript_23128/g.38705  ORF Transcript_23128/g.38705 Transcript_23128/m.38705 type:complete len:397 (-) Transcript_23128:345-1535(-)